MKELLEVFGKKIGVETIGTKNGDLKVHFKWFDEIAGCLFNKTALVSKFVNDDKKEEEYLYRIGEIEFYYYDEENHPDIFCHIAEPQKTKGCWYIHQSGMDITFGDGKNFGGILIRAIVKGVCHENRNVTGFV